MISRPLRVGDAERFAAANRLATHTAAGRLTLAEYDQRVAAAWTARTGPDLDVLFGDLPTPGEPRSARRPPVPTAAVLTALAVVVLLMAWLATVAHPAWASDMAGMMPGCM